MSEDWRPVSFSPEQIAQSGGSIRVGYLDGRPFTPVSDDTDPTPRLERLQARFAAGLLEDEIAWLRANDMGDLADMWRRMGVETKPTARWLRERLRKHERSTEKKYKRAHPEQVRKSKRSTNANWREKHKPEFDKARLSRPFVVIDSEGQDYPGNPEDRGGVRFEKHGTYVWCASTHDPGEPTHILSDPASTGKDKRQLGVKQILDWLLSLPAKYEPVKINRKNQGGAVFLMFGSGYDITQILSRTSLNTAHNVVKRVSYTDDQARDAPEFWGEYAFSYMKGKWFDIWRLRDHNHPIKNDGRIDAIDHIKIYDVLGYFQKPFADVVDDMLKRKMADEYEQTLIKEMKARRGDFADETIERITEYCLTECRLLSKQMGQLRQMMFDFGIRPLSWHGPGALASAVFRKEKIARHFGEHISASDISEQQDWAHHAFIGGRIETLKQGYLKSAALYVYDVSSCYPAGAADLPSLSPEHGRWRKAEAAEFLMSPPRAASAPRQGPRTSAGPVGPTPIAEGASGPPKPGKQRFSGLADLLAFVDGRSPVSMFKVRWKFPTVEKRITAPRHILGGEAREFWEGIHSRFIPFFPLPYRMKSGAILFPSSGRSIAMRDDLVSAIRWLMKFAPEFPRKKTLGGSEIVFEIDGAWIWEIEGDPVYPFAFIRDFYNQRRAIKDEAKRTKIYNPMEIVIKLVINSIYGKLAQFVGEQGKVPKTANPYYAAAITAYGRRRLCEAALVDPYSVVFFATDGILSDKPLHGFDGGLARVKIEGRDVISLGDWEFANCDGGLFVGSGIYIYWKQKVDEKGEPIRDANKNIKLEEVAKLRGARVKNYKLNEAGEPWLVANVLPVWRGIDHLPDPDNRKAVAAFKEFGLVKRDYKTFVTIGSALTGDRWPLAGRWSPKPGEPMAFQRSINVHELGVKRMLNIHKLDELVNAEGRPAKRTYELIPTIPTLNLGTALSDARPPEWINEETGEREENDWAEGDAIAGVR